MATTTGESSASLPKSVKMATTGESSSSLPKPTNDKPVIVRVKRKASQSRLDAFWLEINERPSKRPLLQFEKLLISESFGKEELKAKKVFVQHVETVTTSDAAVDIVQSFVSNSADALYDRTKRGERRSFFKKDNRHDRNFTKGRQQQEELAKTARFEQIWRSRKRNKEEMHDKALHEICHFYDVVRVDIEERSKELHKQEDISLEDRRLLASYLPMLREFIPGAAEEIEADIHAYMSQQDDYVYDYYTANDDMNVDEEDASHPLTLVQVDDEDIYDGPADSEYDSEDSNAEGNPQNDYPDEMSEQEDEEEEEEEKEEGEESEEGSESESETSSASRDVDLLNEDDDSNDYDIHYEYYGNEEVHGDGEDWRWSLR